VANVILNGVTETIHLCLNKQLHVWTVPSFILAFKLCTKTFAPERAPEEAKTIPKGSPKGTILERKITERRSGTEASSPERRIPKYAGARSIIFQIWCGNYEKKPKKWYRNHGAILALFSRRLTVFMETVTFSRTQNVVQFVTAFLLQCVQLLQHLFCQHGTAGLEISMSKPQFYIHRHNQMAQPCLGVISFIPNNITFNKHFNVLKFTSSPKNYIVKTMRSLLKCPGVCSFIPFNIKLAKNVCLGSRRPKNKINKVLWTSFTSEYPGVISFIPSNIILNKQMNMLKLIPIPTNNIVQTISSLLECPGVCSFIPNNITLADNVLEDQNSQTTKLTLSNGRALHLSALGLLSLSQTIKLWPNMLLCWNLHAFPKITLSKQWGLCLSALVFVRLSQTI
jgi:hypothetical protein